MPGELQEEGHSSVPGSVPWQLVPYLFFDRDDRRVRLSAYWCGSADGGWSVPSLRE